ncbi:unnamed protein product [Macrosiphum euphorbiae]|uniref:RNA-directed DNA polymerase n=1 Tax=Macrosiphum euphorbiae TaxID=13131 RepID=A0AAV0VII2_9HEMI|nr:unnamed protein product [Macrosiphum euphorbiae]
MSDGKEGKSVNPVSITAPTYNDLVSLVERLTTQLKTADNSAAVLDELGKLKSSLTAKVETDQKKPEPREPLEFRVVSDLAKGVEKFHGRETSVMAEDWLLAVKGLASVNAWPFSYTLQYLRMHVEAAAKDWFMGRSFCDWTDFEKKFRKTFVRASSVSDRLDLMKARKQGKNEALMDYFQPKMRMCRELSLSLEDSKDYLLRGLYARNLALYVVGRRHVDEDELLEDMLSWDRMNALHQPTVGFERKAEFTKTQSVVKSSTSWGSRPAVQPVQPKPSIASVSSGSSVNSAAMCWNCRTVGHLSRDCPTRRRSATCYGCGVVGHIRPNCPERGQSSVAVVARETRSHPYRRVGRINGQEVDVLLDTGSHYNLVKASVAISCGLSVKPTDKSLYGLGSTTIPSVRAVGMAYAEIAVDDVCPGQVSMLVVPDTVQQPDVIIGREWLDMPSVEYRKVDGQLHLYRAEPCSGQTETTVTTVGCDADFIHTVEQHVIPARLPLTEASEKTAFITSDTTGEFTRMPFGLSGAVAEFTRLMQRVLGPLQGKIVRNYLDDMIIEGRDWTDMLRKLRLVLDRLRDAKLTLKPSKCQFGTAQVEFLGFVVENGEIRPGREKTRAIVEYPVPSDVHSVRRFLGLTGFFRRFVLGYAVIAEPLTALLRKGVKFQWADGQEQAFRKLQDALVGDTVQCMFRRDAEVTELHTDASADGLGAVLLQSMEKGEGLRLVYCASRKTSVAESRYHSSKLELLCLVWAVNKLRQFLLGIKFVILTDCQALVYLNNFKNLNAQVARWHDSLQEYEYEVKYRAGHQMTHVDALSRAPVSTEEPPLDDVLAERIDVVGVLLSEEERVAMCQSSDVDIARVKLDMSTTGDTCGEFVLKGGLLYRRYRDKLLFVMPKSMRKSLVVTAHDLSGHPAVDITMANILQDFWFSGMRRYVRLHINVCFECLLTKDPRGKRPGYLHPIPIGKRPFDTVHIDHVGPFVTTPDGFKYVLTIVDNFTKFISLYAVKDTSADQLIERVQLFVDTYGLPRRFVTDRGSCYTSGAFELFCLQRGIVLIWNSSRHPQANGQVERSHSVVMAALRTAGVVPDGWSELLPDVQRVINNSESKTTTRTPFEMLHGYRPRFHLGALRGLSTTVDDWTPPEGLRIGAHQAMEVSKRKMKIAYDARRHDNTHYQVGEVVVMKRAPNSTGESTKLQNRYRGPLVVSEVLPGDIYRVTDLYSGRPSRFATTAHVAQLKSWKLIDAEEEGRLAAEANVPGDAATTPEMSNQDADRPESVVVQKEGRPRREPRPPVWLKDYDTCS